ncbi:hypothetical protein [Oleidesulfovibrio sp.]|uniref:hypothetical protein n=1 Tax=Oleidesulfovibrio sp. TaxID=2909707 RepID=UPI003A862399
MPFTAVAKVARSRYETDPAVQMWMTGVKRHIEELALDVGLVPERNVLLSVTEQEVRLGVSEEMDAYLRESSGGWRID